jgi:hypothetical protein
MTTKRVVALGDLHCGALIGLTGAPWRQQIKEGISDENKRNKYTRIATALWKQYDRMLKALAPIHVLLVNGDMIDGTGRRSGGTELITTDRMEQAEMAAHAINHARMYAGRGFKIVGTYGTAYHTSGDGEDWENVVADKAGFHKLGSHEWVDVSGCVFDLKHHIGNTSIPHGKGTALLKTMLWQELWAGTGMAPRANVILRSHVHRFFGAMESNKMGFTLPAMCGMGSKFGSRICEGTVDFGMMHFDVSHKGDIVDFDKHIVTLQEQKATTTKV